jgi:GT2 family glycosyltransferase
MTVDVIIPSLGKPILAKCVASLRYIPFPIRLYVMLDDSWSRSINKALKESTNDVIIMDDDAMVLPNTFDDFDTYRDMGDMVGFKLLFPNGTIQHAGGIALGTTMWHIGHGEADTGQFDKPLYCCHLTGALIYVKRHVFDKIGFMDEGYSDGYGFDDVDFSLRAFKAGFKLLYNPHTAIHVVSVTKNTDPECGKKTKINNDILNRKYLSDPGFVNLINAYPKFIYEYA